MKLSNRAKVLIGLSLLLLISGFFIPTRIPPISLPAEPIFHVAGFPITNTIITAWLTILILLVLTWRATRSMQLVPRGAQNFIETVLEGALSIAEGVAGKEHGRRFFPVLMTVFLFIVVANWMALLPGFGTIGIIEHPHGDVHHEEWDFNRYHVGPIEVGILPFTRGELEGDIIRGVFVPILRGANSDLNMTLALATVTMVFIQFWGIRALGFVGYGSKFINLKGGPIGFFVGLIDIISEVARIISFTFRLFGNIFAGEILLFVIGFIIPLVGVLPFFGLEIFVGFIQAFVFALLALAFGTLAVASHDHGPSHGETAEAARHH